MIVVFGATGFIGTYITDQLIRDGHEVLATDINEIGGSYYQRQGVPYQQVDITSAADMAALPTENVEAVLHLACVQPANVSERAYNPADYIRVNVLGTLNILEYCRRNNVPKIIYTASHRNTQGMWAEKAGQPIRESDGRALKFTGEYAMFSISESAATDCVEHYAQTYGIEGIVLRLPPVYGYGPHTEIFMHGKPLKTGLQLFMENAQAGRPIEVWGDPESGRDIVYVKDVVTAITRALDAKDISGLYNISSGRRLTLKEQAEAIARLFSQDGKPVAIVYRPELPNSIESYVYDISRAREVLGWQPEYSFQDMLLDYQKEQQSGRFSFLLEKRQKMLKAALA